MLRRLLFAAVLVLVCPSFAHANSSFTGWCTLANAWTRVTNCTVTVFDAGTANLSTIYSDSVGTPLANPFTASSTTGKYQFFAANASYDVRLSGGTPTISPAYVQYSAVALLDITGSTVAFTGDIVPVTDNTGNVGTAAKTWAGARFTNLTVDSATTTGTLASGAATFGGHVTFPSDNTYDIGASGATRPRSAYFGSSVYSGGAFFTRTTTNYLDTGGGGNTETIVASDSASGNVEFRTNLTSRWRVASSGHMLALADNTYDIGASGATRPRDLFLGRNATVGGNVAITGTVTTGAQITASGSPAILAATNNGGGISFQWQSTNIPSFQLYASVPGVVIWRWDNSFNFLPGTNLGYDIGATGTRVATTYQGTVNSNKYATGSNCTSSASPAVCSAAAAGSVVIAAAATSVVVNTTAVTANSQIFVQNDSSLGTKLSVTCNTQSSLVLGAPRVTARTAATSFTITIEVGPTTNPMCLSYAIIN